jgi:hypothetical protein
LQIDHGIVGIGSTKGKQVVFGFVRLALSGERLSQLELHFAILGCIEQRVAEILNSYGSVARLKVCIAGMFPCGGNVGLLLVKDANNYAGRRE